MQLQQPAGVSRAHAGGTPRSEQQCPPPPSSTDLAPSPSCLPAFPAGPSHARLLHACCLPQWQHRTTAEVDLQSDRCWEGGDMLEALHRLAEEY